MRGTSGGFTLTELLVVVAILGTLAALLLPAVSRAIERGNMAADTSKLHQISIALAAFVGEHNRFPYTQEVVVGPQAGRWWEAVDRYFPPMPGFLPNSDWNYQNGPGKGGGRDCWFAKNRRDPRGYSGLTLMSFGPNPYMEGPPASQGDASPARLTNASKLVAVTEINGSSVNSIDTKKSPTHQKNQLTGSAFGCGYRASQPGGAALFLFCDFHVEAIAGDQSEGSAECRVKWGWW